MAVAQPYLEESPFTSAEFVNAWVSGLGSPWHTWPVRAKEHSRQHYAAFRRSRLGLGSLHFGPASLYATVPVDNVPHIVRALSRFRVVDWTWNVRFDEPQLAEAVGRHAAHCVRSTTWCLRLGNSHEETISRYGATIRNQMRKALRRGVNIRLGGPADAAAYFELCRKVDNQRGQSTSQYPGALFEQLVRLDGLCRLYLGEVNGQMVCGAICFRDRDQALYWHGAADRDYSEYFASRAVLDAAIQWAQSWGAKVFNFGGSGGIKSLEEFKTAWGAEPLDNWHFSWKHPLWIRILRTQSWFSRSANRQG